MELVPPGHDDTGSLLRALFGDHYRVASHPLRGSGRGSALLGRGITVALTIAALAVAAVATHALLRRRYDRAMCLLVAVHIAAALFAIVVGLLHSENSVLKCQHERSRRGSVGTQGW